MVMDAAELIKEFEGLRLKAYPDPGTGGKPWTIGYGHTRGVKQGDTITLEQALVWLRDDMADAYAIVDNAVTVPLSRQQRDALCSFVFNVGGAAFQKSTLLRLLNQKDYNGAAAQLPRWNKAGGRTLAGLVRRRGKERALFLSGTNLPTPAFPQEEDMAPIAVALLTQALPALISRLPEIAQIFSKPDVRERNVEAVAKVGQIIVEATGSTNAQEAVEKIEADPEMARAANEALRLNRADLMDAAKLAWEMDEKSVADARAFSRTDKPLVGSWHFVHIISLLLILMGGGSAIAILFISIDSTERAVALNTLLMVGFVSVVAFWLGSSRSSQLKDLRNQ